ncbi:MAG: c-type cytochrome [Pseudomonadota bacterium]
MNNTILILLFACFALGLPIWAMQTNQYDRTVVSGCTGSCYEQWREETGGAAAVAQAQVAMKAEASPAELGEMSYAGCAACHGAGGEGGIGPKLAGQDSSEIVDKLLRYQAGEEVGPQSNLMWGQAAILNTNDIDNLAAYIATF